MKESIEEIVQNLQEIEKVYRSLSPINLKILEKTKSIVKARLSFSEEFFVQIYVNLKRVKKSYSLIFDDRRIFGKDCILGQWHLHPFEHPDEHDESEDAKRTITIEKFVERAFFIVSEELEIL